MALDMRWGAVTHVGCVRKLNQDATLAGPTLFVVADGMGGHAAGEVASALAIAHLAEIGGPGPLHKSDIVEALRSLNADIRRQAEIFEDKAGMGTTVVGLAVVDDHGAERLCAFNVGDSRAYRLHHGILKQVSVDHSLVGELVLAGNISKEEAKSHPSRNVVTRALGADDGVDPDLWVIEPVAGDRFLLCSDGLTNEVDDEAIATALGALADPQAVVDQLLAAALSNGARDNVSVVIIEVVGVNDAHANVDEDTNPHGYRPPDSSNGVGTEIGAPAQTTALISSVPLAPSPGAVEGQGDEAATLITGLPSGFPRDFEADDI